MLGQLPLYSAVLDVGAAAFIFCSAGCWGSSLYVLQCWMLGQLPLNSAVLDVGAVACMFCSA